MIFLSDQFCEILETTNYNRLLLYLEEGHAMRTGFGLHNEHYMKYMRHPEVNIEENPARIVILVIPIIQRLKFVWCQLNNVKLVRNAIAEYLQLHRSRLCSL